MDQHITTFIHNGTVYTIGTRNSFNFRLMREQFEANVSVANGTGISYPFSHGVGADTESEAVSEAISMILAADPIVSYAVTMEGTTFATFVRSLDEVALLTEDVDFDISVTEMS